MADNPFLQQQKTVPAAKKDFTTDINEVYNELSNLSRRVRQMEEQYLNLRKKLQVIEQNILSSNKRIQQQLDSSTQEMTDVHIKMEELRESMRLIIKELKMGAKKEEVDILRKYITLWEPVKFVSHSEVEKIIQDVVAAELAKRNI